MPGRDCSSRRDRGARAVDECGMTSSATRRTAPRLFSTGSRSSRHGRWPRPEERDELSITASNPLPRELADELYWLGPCYQVPVGGRSLHATNSVFLVAGSPWSALVDAGISWDTRTILRQIRDLTEIETLRPFATSSSHIPSRRTRQGWGTYSLTTWRRRRTVM